MGQIDDDEEGDLVPVCAVEENPDGTTKKYDICELDSCPLSKLGEGKNQNKQHPQLLRVIRNTVMKVNQ